MPKANQDGSIKTTTVDGSSKVSPIAADGGWNVVESDHSEPMGIYHPSGAYNVTFVRGGPPIQGRHKDGSILVRIGSNLGPRPLTVDDLDPTASGFDEIELAFSPVDNADSYEFRYRQDGTNEWSDWEALPSADPTVALLEDSTTYEFQVRGVNSLGRPGKASDIAEETTFTPGWVLRDSNFVTILGTEASPGDLDLDAMGAAANEALDREAGDLLLVFGASAHGGGSTKQVTQGAATGWTELVFDNDAAGTGQTGVRVLEKICEGDETTVDVFDNAAATTNDARVCYIVLALTPTGVPTFVSGGADSRIANQPQQTIPCAGAGPGVLAWTFHAAAGSTNVGPLLTGVTPGIEITVGSDTTFALHMELQAHIFPSGTDPVDLTTNPADAGNNGHAWGFHKVEMPV